MIEKMNFVSISGPKDDLDRIVNKYLSHYAIHLENAMDELKTAAKLVPYPGTNPYREAFLKAQTLTEGIRLPKNTVAAPMDIREAMSVVEDADKFLAEHTKKQEELTAKKADIQSLLEQIRLYEGLDFDIPAILKFQHIKFRFGRVVKELYPQLEHFAETSAETILVPCHETEQYRSLIYFVPEAVSERIDAVYSSMQFERIFLSDRFAGTPQEETKRLEQELSDCTAGLSSLEQERTAWTEQKKERVFAAFQVLKDYEANFNVRKFAACIHEKDHPFYILCGWMAADDTDALRRELDGEPDTFFVIEDRKEHITGTPPTKLKNIPLLRPFEMFVKMYGLPSYDEFDPTILIAITYSVFFGFMFGDAGQGLLLLIGGFLLYRTKKINLAAIISCCGFFSTIFGLLFGSVFGFEDVIPALWLRPAKAMTDLPFVGRLNTVFVAAIALGMAMILLTMILNMVVSIRNHDTGKAWFDPNGMAGFVFYAALAAVIVLFMNGNPVPAVSILVILFLVPLLLIFLKEPLTAIVERKSEKLSGGLGMFFTEGFFELFEVLLSYFSNTLSFVRVGAFAVSHAAMMEVVLMLAGAETGSPNLLVILFGNLFVCGMEGLIVGIQVLRLEYYELFSRFYKGTGREFKPFHTNES